MDLFDLIMSLPLIWKLIAVFLLIIANTAYIFRKQLIKLFQIFFKKNTMNLSTHKLFTEKTYLKHKINLINVGSDGKNKIFRELLLLKYDSILKQSKELLNIDDLSKISNSQFYALIIKNMTNIVKEYNDNFKLKFGDKIYSLVMEHSEKGFNVIHEKTIVFIKGNIEESLTSNHVVLTTPEDKIDFLFDMYYIAMKIALTDVNKIYKNFNGDLDKLIKKQKL